MTERETQRFWGKVRKQDGEACWLWIASKNPKGYGQFSRKNDAGDYVTRWAHRCSWELHNGPIPEGICVLHTCDNPACVRPSHLWIGTVADNNRDMCVKERQVRGCQNGRAKLNPEKIREIRALAASGTSGVALARRFEVCKASISYIVRGETWRHVKGDELCSAVCEEIE